jgi:hypothetical protein
MPTPRAPPALAGTDPIDQVPVLRVAAAREIQRRGCSAIFLKLTMFEFELKSGGRYEP